MSDRGASHFGETYDVGIVGGGPAGLSAAIWSARYLHSVLLVDSGDPRNWQTRGINGYLGFPNVRPADLRARGRDDCRRFGATLIDAIVLRVERVEAELFDICIEGGGRVRARRLLLAIGIRDVWPDIPGLAHVYGANAHVCPDCDGYEARDKRVVVIGNGRHALGMALDLATWTRDIVICTNGRPADLDKPEYCRKLDALGIRVLTDAVRRVCYEGTTIDCLELENGSRLKADKVFFTIGQYPADDLGAQLGCKRDSGGHILVDEHLHTSARYVYAAGDITPGPQLAIAAAAEGAVAALSIHKSLVPDVRRLRSLKPRRSATSPSEV